LEFFKFWIQEGNVNKWGHKWGQSLDMRIFITFFSVMYKLPPWLYRYALDLLQQARRNVQGYAYNEYYLYDIHTSIGMKSAD